MKLVRRRLLYLNSLLHSRHTSPGLQHVSTTCSTPSSSTHIALVGIGKTSAIRPVTLFMESPQKKAPASMSMDGSKAPHLLPVTLAKKTPRPDLVRRVSAWALFTACDITLSIAVGTGITYALNYFHVRCSQSSFFLRCDQRTDAEEAMVNALGIGLLCCFTLQAAAAVLALRVPCRHRRRAIAYLALVLTIVGHCILAAIAHILLGADPGDLLFRICTTVGLFVFAAGDIISFLALLLGGEE